MLSLEEFLRKSLSNYVRARSEIVWDLKIKSFSSFQLSFYEFLLNFYLSWEYFGEEGGGGGAASSCSLVKLVSGAEFPSTRIFSPRDQLECRLRHFWPVSWWSPAAGAMRRYGVVSWVTRMAAERDTGWVDPRCHAAGRERDTHTHTCM